MLHKQWSADDVLAGSAASSIYGRRARSASPTKSRPLSQNFDFQSLLHAHSTASLPGDLASQLYTGSLSPDQIKRLSRLPIARKIRISTSQHALPIPFKLQLPPKLSYKLAPPSPEPNRGRTATSPKRSEKALPPSPARQSPRRLIFNGSAYEPAELSESELELSFWRPSGPHRPPATIANRKKVARFAQKHQSMPADQLSMIEEASSKASSRTSSVREDVKKVKNTKNTRKDELPPTPPALAQNSSNNNKNTRSIQRKPPPDLQSPAPVPVQKPRLELVLPPPPPAKLPTSVSAPLLSQNRKINENGPSTDSSFDAPRRLETRVVTEAPRRRPEASSYTAPKEIQMFPTTPEPGTQFVKETTDSPIEAFPQTPPEPKQGIPHSHACHYKLNLGEQTYLKIGKRSFSDESKVLSVSSFSSVGDILNVHHDPAVRLYKNDGLAVSANIARYLTNRPSRDASSASTSSTGTQSSWNSIQKSVDISIGDSLLASEKSSISSRSVSKSGLKEIYQIQELEENSFAEETTQPLKIVRTNANETLVDDAKEPEKADNDDQVSFEVEDETETSGLTEDSGSVEESETESDSKEDVSVDDGNTGLGRGFSFPNDMTNITNSEEAKRRLERQRLHARSNSSLPLTRSCGQIQIPNLDELDNLLLRPVLETKFQGMSFNDFEKLKLHGADKENVSDIEPIGVPSVAAKQHLSEMYGNMSSSEADSSFENESNASARKPLRAPPKEMPTSVSLGAIASRKSPIRHARHRLMYSFDFADIYQDPTPNNSISRNKAASGHKASKSISTPLEAPKIVVDNPNSSTQDSLKNMPYLNQDDQEQPLNIVVAEPPKKVQYAVDFKEAVSPKKPDPSFEQKFGTPYYQHSMRRNGTRRCAKPPSEQSNQISKSSQSMFSDSLVTARETISTTPTDADSVIIDLTKEDYNICMIKRNDSTLSYRSVIEKRDGKPVEVVLVEEDEEKDSAPKLNPEDRDDLLSIYSRYMSGWERQKLSLQAKAQRRVGSGLSDASGSWVSSEAGFQVKTMKPNDQHKTQMRKATMPNLDSFRNSQQSKVMNSGKRIQLTPKLGSYNTTHSTNARDVNNRGNSVYFDYHGNEKYDFNSFMQQRL